MALLLDRSGRLRPIAQIRTPLAQFSAEVEKRASAEPPRASLVALVRALDVALVVCEQARQQTDSAVKRNDRATRALIQQVVQEASDSRRAPTARDGADAQKAHAKRLAENARNQLVKKIGEALSQSATSAGERVVAAAQSFDVSIERAQVDALTPVLPNDSDLQRWELEARRWAARGPIDFQQYVESSLKVYDADQAQLERLEFLALEVADLWGRVPDQSKARQRPRPSSVQADASAIRWLKHVAKSLSEKRRPEWLSFYVESARPRALAFIRTIVGVDPRQLTRVGFERTFLTPGKAPGPFAIQPDWQTRYCSPTNADLASRSFEVEFAEPPARLGGV